MPQKRSTDGRHMRMLFAFMCYALLGTIIFSFLHYETVQNEVAQRRHKLDSLISKFAQKITEAANDPEKQVNVSTMKRYVEPMVHITENKFSKFSGLGEEDTVMVLQKVKMLQDS
ncbi:hypothetical protein Y032_0199g1668 [Ancylostoma ceylanicum]|uniref:Uncharacterized protein n=1 Tax=Ancylostoma ceylanicum TaxID=53326 RepID=A0A016SMV7_9BILA|nr:hypothetical protein Y032_0199g1668 [Ancylostoma ceylanicum]